MGELVGKVLGILEHFQNKTKPSVPTYMSESDDILHIYK